MPPAALRPKRHPPRRPPVNLERRVPEPEADPAQLRLKVWLRLLRVTRDVNAELRDRLRETGRLTLAQFEALSVLARAGGGMTMTELADALLVSQGNVTGLVGRLETRGLVRRGPLARDRRSAVVGLTPEGRAAVEAIAEHHRRWISKCLGALDADQCESLLALFADPAGRLRRVAPPPPVRRLAAAPR
jgi:DNA-binding MarR family transcriptional regulator